MVPVGHVPGDERPRGDASGLLCRCAPVPEGREGPPARADEREVVPLPQRRLGVGRERAQQRRVLHLRKGGTRQGKLHGGGGERRAAGLAGGGGPGACGPVKGDEHAAWQHSAEGRKGGCAAATILSAEATRPKQRSLRSSAREQAHEAERGLSKLKEKDAPQ